VGNLLLVRSFARRQEMAVRLSVGAGFRRLLKQLFTEQLALSCFAVAGGFLLAYWCRNVIVLLRPRAPGVAVNLPAEIDWRVMALSAAVCLASAFLLGLIPALQVSKVDLAGALRTESGGVVGGRGKRHLRSGLILMQVALSFVLLAATGLLARSVQEIRNTNPGFDTHDLLTTYVDFTDAGYDAARSVNFEDELADRVRQVPEVRSIAFSRVRPFTYGSYATAKIVVEGYETAPDEQPTADYNEISPGYLATLGIPLVSGREFRRADDETAPLVAMVDENMAAQYWRGQDPVGKRLQVGGRWVQIVGVAKASKYRTLAEPVKPFFYVPLRQSRLGSVVFLRTALAPDLAAKLLAREMRRLDPSILPSEVLRMREQVDRMTWTQRAALKLLGVFGALALALAAIGLYGVMSYSVSQSARELGLRMALGASPVDVLRMVVSNGLLLTVAGLTLGAAAALLLTRLLGDLLYKTSPRDPVAFAAAFAVIALASLAAFFVPAYRASQTDPAAVLRN
jgi:predicted permease